ncbi:piRNA biogenesis protein EXD1 [Suncus etruscus]|uniref:piRNA biogenesis protein EXD1 n=1 Tax=Suncus etruscus TaxID=109475 RepID=UPI00210FDC6E|nr:piRNA biogenesis protein EXD1 [Suncus etruscus]
MDPSSDYHFLNQILWKRVKLTLVCGIFEGVIQHVDPNKIIVLKKVKNVETGRHIPGVKMFFGHEIVNVELLDEEEQGTERENTSVSLKTERTMMEKVKDEDQNVYKHASSTPEMPINSLLNDFKFSHSEDEDVTYTVIDQFQQKFGAAMLHIKKQSVLSVAAEGTNVCRHGKLCWLQVATNSRVYLFDIFLLGRRAFNNGLQMVLEDKKILKVIHDCRRLSDCLSHQYGILLNNVFDTQVADVLQFSMETSGFLPNCISTLQDCLIKHLKVAPKYLSFLEERKNLIQENPDVWFMRPLSPSLLKSLALETAYLLPLRLVFLDAMMSDLTTLVDSYLNAYRERSADSLGSIEPTCMELPEELLQLKDFQKQRREKAAKQYSVNEQGLLIRTVLHPKSVVEKTLKKEERIRGFLLCENSMLDKATSFTSAKDVSLLKGESKCRPAPAELKPLHPLKEKDPGMEASGSFTRPESKGLKEQNLNLEEYLKTPKHEFQTKLSLKEEIEKLMMANKEDLQCTKHDVSKTCSFPRESLKDTLPPFTEALLSTLPPCPALEKTDC